MTFYPCSFFLGLNDNRNPNIFSIPSWSSSFGWLTIVSLYSGIKSGQIVNIIALGTFGVGNTIVINEIGGAGNFGFGSTITFSATGQSIQLVWKSEIITTNSRWWVLSAPNGAIIA